MLSSLDSLPKDISGGLICLICDRKFEDLHALMLHLNSSYPSFDFQYGRSEKNVIDVALRNESCSAQLVANGQEEKKKKDFLLDK